MCFARTLLVLALLFGGLAEAASAEHQYIITTIAGTGESGPHGDGGPASQARLNRPAGVAVDGDGNLFIADRYNHRIRRVDPSGTITTFAGGQSLLGEFFHPSGVSVDGDGDVYVADTHNHRIRKVDPSTRRCRGWLPNLAPQAGRRDHNHVGTAGERSSIVEPGCGRATRRGDRVEIQDRADDRRVQFVGRSVAHLPAAPAASTLDSLFTFTIRSLGTMQSPFGAKS